MSRLQKQLSLVNNNLHLDQHCNRKRGRFLPVQSESDRLTCPLESCILGEGFELWVINYHQLFAPATLPPLLAPLQYRKNYSLI